jgi:hypothetical protein
VSRAGRTADTDRQRNALFLTLTLTLTLTLALALPLPNPRSVKYFNAEQYEADRYCGAVSSYQKYSVSVQYSLSLLNIAQQLLMQGTMCGAMVIMIYTSDDVGAFVAVQAYLIQLFTPLNFLGTSPRRPHCPTATPLTPRLGKHLPTRGVCWPCERDSGVAER